MERNEAGVSDSRCAQCLISGPTAEQGTEGRSVSRQLTPVYTPELTGKSPEPGWGAECHFKPGKKTRAPPPWLNQERRSPYDIRVEVAARCSGHYSNTRAKRATYSGRRVTRGDLPSSFCMMSLAWLRWFVAICRPSSISVRNCGEACFMKT